MDAVLQAHPDIAQAVAFGVPDDKYGEEVSQSKQTFFSLGQTQIANFLISMLYAD